MDDEKSDGDGKKSDDVDGEKSDGELFDVYDEKSDCDGEKFDCDGGEEADGEMADAPAGPWPSSSPSSQTRASTPAHAMCLPGPGEPRISKILKSCPMSESPLKRMSPDAASASTPQLRTPQMPQFTPMDLHSTPMHNRWWGEALIPRLGTFSSSP